MRLAGKVVIVTGGARGLGGSTRCALPARALGWWSLISWRGARAKSEIEAAGGEAIALYTDVSDEESVERMIRRTIETFGRIDVLINNAAIFADVAKYRFYDMPLQEWDRIMRVNLTGTFLCCKAVYPEMKKQGKGKIINVSSATFYLGTPNLSHYVTSKGAVVASYSRHGQGSGRGRHLRQCHSPGIHDKRGYRRKPYLPGSIPESCDGESMFQEGPTPIRSAGNDRVPGFRR